MSTLKSAAEIDRVFQCGQRLPSPLVIGLVAPTPSGRDQQGRVAFIAGKRIGGAVKRNRAKRLLRAAMAEAGGPWPGFDVVLLARERSLRVGSGEIARDIAGLIKRAGVIE